MTDPSRKPCDLADGVNFANQDGITNGGAWYSLKGGMTVGTIILVTKL